MRVAILDYGSGNLHSASRALEEVGADVVLTSDSAVALDADGLIVPGVGAFAACMDQLRAVGGDETIREAVSARRPLLGICVGHQVLFSRGVEHGIDSLGVGIFPGSVELLPATHLPHMGWNTITWDKTQCADRDGGSVTADTPGGLEDR
ncbi:MAG: imidazole glycerol phosphate synthase subunit HisH, partial [Propionibacteriaceae bacterium]|nr:imidazole glycerol phosphate synthase subunit HisH [Propionibacteriaceae bacterium]